MINNLFSIPLFSWDIKGEELARINGDINRALVDERRVADNDVWQGEVDTTFHKTGNAIEKYSMGEFDRVVAQYTEQAIVSMVGNCEQQHTFNYYVSECWFNIGKPGSFQFDHVHQYYTNSGVSLSGVYYYQYPDNGGGIVFKNPNQSVILSDALWTLSMVEETHWTPKNGTLLLFPSFLMHKVCINKSDQERISISFNVNVDVQT